ncbi:hypothetical protein K3217_11810 [bacterium BD-1]|nr:hypothetical protein [Ottowia caeni]
MNAADTLNCVAFEFSVGAVVQAAQAIGISLLPRSQLGGHARQRSDHDLDVASEQIGQGGADAAIRHVHHENFTSLLEQFAHHVLRRAIACTAERQLAWVFLCVGNQFSDCRGR